jgi:hypothetical protein
MPTAKRGHVLGDKTMKEDNNNSVAWRLQVLRTALGYGGRGGQKIEKAFPGVGLRWLRYGDRGI